MGAVPFALTALITSQRNVHCVARLIHLCYAIIPGSRDFTGMSLNSKYVLFYCWQWIAVVPAPNFDRIPPSQALSVGPASWVILGRSFYVGLLCTYCGLCSGTMYPDTSKYQVFGCGYSCTVMRDHISFGAALSRLQESRIRCKNHHIF